MKTFVVVFAALIAMSFAQDKVRVVEQPNQSSNILPNPDPGFSQPSNPPNNVNILTNPDPGFYRPSQGPAFVDNSNSGRPPYPYPYKQYSFPGARGGK